MKKIIVLCLAMLTALALTACRRSSTPMLPETTVPLATVKPTVPKTEPAPTYPAETRKPTEAVRPHGTESIPDVPGTTIEDGNGPTPSQMSSFNF